MERPKTMRDVEDFISGLRRKGVQLWTDGGTLRYRARKGILTANERGLLTDLKVRITDYLSNTRRANEFDPQVLPSQNGVCAPLTFSQQWEWNRWGAGRARHRVVCTTIELCGRVEIEALRCSIQALSDRHEALRTRVVSAGGEFWQKVDERASCSLELIDISHVFEGERDNAARDIIKRIVEEPVNASTGPLFEANLLKMADDRLLLVMAMDHIIADGVSTCIVVDEVMTLYACFVGGLTPTLRKVPVQPRDYALWQRRETTSWLEKHGRYWDGHLENARHIQLFPTESICEGGYASLEAQSIRFDAALSEELRRTSRREGTTLALSIVSIYAALVSRWCDTTDVVIPFITEGRDRPEIENVVGQFAYPVFLRIQFGENDDFHALLQKVTEEYASAIEHRDSGRMAAQDPMPSFAQNPEFNWIPPELDVASLTRRFDAVKDEVEVKPYPLNILSERIKWDTKRLTEPVICFSDLPEGVGGGIGYLRGCVHLDSIQRFERNLVMFAQIFVVEQTRRLSAIQCIP